MASTLAMIDRRPLPMRSGSQACATLAVCRPVQNEIECRSTDRVAPAPDGEPALAVASRARHVVEKRARRMLDARFKFVAHPDFGDSTATNGILGPLPETVGSGKGAGRARGRQTLADSDADFQRPRFLTREQEVHLFRKMNFLKYQAAQLLEAINPTRARSADLDRIDELLREAGAIRNRIVGSYLALVVSVVKKFIGSTDDFLDLVSEGNVSLIQASEQFDCGRGTRFSTYATLAIFNNLVRRFPRGWRRRIRFATGRDGLLQALADHRDDDRTAEMDEEQSRYTIRKLLGNISGREQTIIVRRFGLAGDERTLVQIGDELGISKERVRQLESCALGKLRALAEVRKLDRI